MELALAVIFGHNALPLIQPVTGANLLPALLYDSPFLYKTAAGLPVLQSEMTNRLGYPEASLWGATPSLISWKGPAAREIAAIADELDMVLGAQQAAA